MIWIRPTRVGLLFTAASAVSVAVALMNVALITALVASMLCSFLLVSLLLSLCSVVGVRVERDLAGEGACMDDLSLPLHVRNLLPLFRQDFVIREKLPFCREKSVVFEVPCLRPVECMTLERKVRAVKRGHFHLKKLSLIGGDPAGLFAVQRSFSLPGEVLIVPQCVAPGEFVGGSDGENSFSYEGRLTSRAGLGNDFYGVRPYRAGDEMRHIHWRLSAAKQKLMVREFEALAIDQAVLVLDTDQSRIGMDDLESNFEKLVSLSSSLVHSLAKQACQLTFLVHCREQGLIRLSGEASALKARIIEILTELESSSCSVETLVMDQLDQFPKGAGVYILSMENGSMLHQAVTLLEENSCNVTVFYAPKECFPYIPEDEPFEFLLQEPVRYRDSARRFLITCQTSFDEWKICHEET